MKRREAAVVHGATNCTKVNVHLRDGSSARGADAVTLQHGQLMAGREDLDARVVACARRFASKPTRAQASARAAQDKASVKAVKRAVPLAPYRGGPLHLRPYQIDGVAWLAFNYLQKRSSILADEMGLGKTVQTVSLVRMAKERYGAQGPALVVAPLSTLAHWQREFEHWSALDVMVYHGSQASRLEARNLDLMARKTAAKKNPKIKTPKTPSVDVVVTTYEQLLLEDSANALGAISWSLLVVDEAHSVGAIGPEGRGVSADQGREPDVLVGTFGKAYGAAGAFVVLDEEAKRLLVSQGRSFVYTTALAEPAAYAALKGFELATDERRERLEANVNRFRDGLRDQGVPTLGEDHVVPVVLAERTMPVAEKLLDKGIFVPGIRYPTVERGQERLRFSLSAAHTEDAIDRALEALSKCLR